MKYQKLKNFVDIEIKTGEVFKFICCDCGLTHNMIIVILDDDTLQMAMERNNRSTAQFRRHLWGYLQQGLTRFKMVLR